MDWRHFHFYTGWHSLVTWRLELLQGLRSPTWILTSSGLAPQPNTKLTSAATRTWPPTGFPQMNNAIFLTTYLLLQVHVWAFARALNCIFMALIRRLRFLSCNGVCSVVIHFCLLEHNSPPERTGKPPLIPVVEVYGLFSIPRFFQSKAC